MDSTGQEASVIKDSAVASAAAFAEVARSLFLADSVEQTLARGGGSLRFSPIEACEFAGAFLLEKDTVTTPVCTASDCGRGRCPSTPHRRGTLPRRHRAQADLLLRRARCRPPLARFRPRGCSKGGCAACWRSPWPRTARWELSASTPATPRPSGSSTGRGGCSSPQMASFSFLRSTRSRGRGTPRREPSSRPGHPRADRPGPRDPHRTRAD